MTFSFNIQSIYSRIAATQNINIYLPNHDINECDSVPQAPKISTTPKAHYVAHHDCRTTQRVSLTAY